MTTRFLDLGGLTEPDIRELEVRAEIARIRARRNPRSRGQVQLAIQDGNVLAPITRASAYDEGDGHQ